MDRLQRKFELRTKGLGAAESLLPVEQAYLDALNYSRLDPERGMAKFQALIDLYGDHADGADPTAQCLELARRQLAKLKEPVQRHGGRSSQRRVEPSGRGRAAPPDEIPNGPRRFAGR